jgi:hypothetical protein
MRVHKIFNNESCVASKMMGFDGGSKDLRCEKFSTSFSSKCETSASDLSTSIQV